MSPTVEQVWTPTYKSMPKPGQRVVIALRPKEGVRFEVEYSRYYPHEEGQALPFTIAFGTYQSQGGDWTFDQGDGIAAFLPYLDIAYWTPIPDHMATHVNAHDLEVMKRALYSGKRMYSLGGWD